MSIRAFLRCILFPLFLFPSISFAMSILPGPAFDPVTELRLHDAIGAEGIVTPSDLNGRLREVDIRTALADTARWRGELG